MKNVSRAALLAASLMMTGCTGATLPASLMPAVTNAAATGKLVLTPQIVSGGYAVSSVVTPNTVQSINHLVVKLFVVGQASESPATDATGLPIQADVVRAELGNPITFTALHPNTSYRARAYAYRAAGTNPADLISTLEGSYVDVNVTNDDQPTMQQLKVTLTDVAFSGTATSSGVTVINGGYSPVAPESLDIGTIGSLQATASDLPITNAVGGYLEPVRIGNRVYQMGAYSNNLKVMVADVQPDGSLSTFVDAGVTLTVPRRAFRRAVIGNRLYVFGGYNPQTASRLTSIEAATIQADGTLGAFQTVSSQLQTGVAGFGLYVGGGKVYVIGGSLQNNSGLTTTQVASINPDGTLENFVANPAINLPAANAGFATVRANGSLYLLGSGYGTRKSVLQAPINPDGSLGNIQDAGVTLNTGRDAGCGAFIGGKLYAIGGNSGSGGVSTIEAATVNPDGSLGAFSVVNGVTLTANEWGHESVIAGNSLYVFTNSHVQRFPIQ
ncbi:MAG TPA: hypothetical protein V6D05_18010 [Stenomitos sp.]